MGKSYGKVERKQKVGRKKGAQGRQVASGQQDAQGQLLGAAPDPNQPQVGKKRKASRSQGV